MAARPSSTPSRSLEATSSLTGDEATGVDIVRRAADEPLRWIAENAGPRATSSPPRSASWRRPRLQRGDRRVRRPGRTAGVIDPVKVTRSALRNAASIAAMVLTTDTLVVEKKEEESEAAGPAHGHGHGH